MDSQISDFPQIDNTCFIHPSAVIAGRVTIGKNVLVGPGAVLRADEPGSSIVIEDNCDIQDNVVIHALENTSVWIGESTSLAHGCVVHGPCKISRDCFVGFNSVVFKSEIEEKSLIKHLAVVENVNIFSRKKVESGQVINCQEDARQLGYISKKDQEFMERVVELNLNLAKSYKDNSRR